MAAALRGGDVAYSAALGLVMGGVVGGTAVAVFWRLPRFLKGLVAAGPSQHHLQKPVLV